MCSSSSIVMPADYEMLVSHSPPIFSSYLSDYGRHRLSPRLPRATTCRSASANSFLLPLRTGTSIKSITNPKPCLVVRPEDEEGCTSPTRLKKKVVFADDRGMSLTHVRVMTEPSNVPPLLSSRFLAEVTQGLSADPVARTEPWEVTFAQPAADYVEFRRRLERDSVSLENVIVKETEEMVVGTIKVKNISFEKEVFLRISSDGWRTSEDRFCTFVSQPTTSVAYVVYDTFSFTIPLPPKSRRLEFCVCFRCGIEEYWDNNRGSNYILIKKMFHETLDGLNKLKIADEERKLTVAKSDLWTPWNDMDRTPYW